MEVTIFGKTIWISSVLFYRLVGVFCGLVIYLIAWRWVKSQDVKFWERQARKKSGMVILGNVHESPKLSMELEGTKVEISFAKLSKGTFRWQRPLLFSGEFNVRYPATFDLEIFPRKSDKLFDKKTFLSEVKTGNIEFDSFYKVLTNDEQFAKQALSEKSQSTLLDPDIKETFWAIHIKSAQCIYYFQGAKRDDQLFNLFLRNLPHFLHAFKF